MPFGFRHPAPQVAATAPGMAPPLSFCSSDRGGADISPDLDQEQDTELAVASDGGAEVLHPAHAPRRSRTQTGRPAPSIGPARWRWPTGRCRHEPGARLGSARIRIRIRIESSAMSIRGLFSRMAQALTSWSVLRSNKSSASGPARGRAVAEGLEGGDRFEQGLLRLGRETGEEVVVDEDDRV